MDWAGAVYEEALTIPLSENYDSAGLEPVSFSLDGNVLTSSATDGAGAVYDETLTNRPSADGCFGDTCLLNVQIVRA